jgi:predicted enzyme related to lactoylglutathione lyase
MKFVHLNIISKDWKKLADFYIKVFDCKPIFPERNLSGKWLDDATAIQNVHISGIHLRLPGFEEGSPSLEIFQYDENIEQQDRKINTEGITHMAFRVEDVDYVLQEILNYGGSQIGNVTKNTIENIGTITFVYAADPEGNIIEIQNWS